MSTNLTRRALAALFVAALVFSHNYQAQAQGAAPEKLKQIMPLRAAEIAEGSRITITSDASLSDYQAYAADNRFYVLLPQSNLASAIDSLSGRGFTDARTERRGNDLLLSFGLTPHAKAQVSQKFNRLDLVFNVAGAEQLKTASVAVTASDALPLPQQESVKKVVGRSINLPPEKAQPVRATRFDKPPVIDGKLDDEVWTHATVFSNFYQFRPGDNIPPSQPTEVLMGYDAKFLYFAFRAHDEAGKVRVTVPKRDQVFNDDTVGMYLDTFNDRRRAFILIFNPYGVQADGIFTEDQGEDYSFDLVMDSKGVVTNDGYTVEVAIPFKSLRYEAGKDKLWGVHFIRQIKRLNNETDSWMPISRENSSLLNQAGHLTGLEGISTEHTLELIPSLTLSETGRRVSSFAPVVGGNDPGRIVNEPAKFDPGLTAKFGITPTVTLDLALNPDFAQVEADQTV
ncbi:MAG TPA: carbohydrate binding family 9 domain-containing protein, partial [Pyrinomonadaceae bacterium]